MKTSVSRYSADDAVALSGDPRIRGLVVSSARRVGRLRVGTLEDKVHRSGRLPLGDPAVLLGGVVRSYVEGEIRQKKGVRSEGKGSLGLEIGF